jgi:DNA polymerase I
MTLRPATPEAIKLFHQGILALSQIEKNGILIDEVYLEKAMRKLGYQIKKLQEKMREHEVAKVWRKRFGNKTNFGSNYQLEKVIFDEFKYERQEGRTTEKGKNKADKYAFEKVDLDFVNWYFECEQLKKALGTNLKGIKKEVMDGYVHPFFDLHTVGTFRSSSRKFNMQNQPIRMPYIGRIIRKCFIAPPGYRIGEIDYGKIEVCGAACYTEDPVLINDVTNPKADMHRDMAMKVFKLKQTQVSKDTRYNAKNKFVFPQFYGSYYIDCAKNLWDSIDSMELKTNKGKGLKSHLKAKGIKERGKCDPKEEPKSGTFEKHLKAVQDEFWEWFKVYAQWKKDWWSLYLNKGYFEFLTGFVCQGLYNRKQVCNYPIQGSAFHMLLWSLIQLHKWLKKNRMKSKIIFEIHDSLGLYFHIKEVDYVIEKALQIMTIDVRKHWPWINVPLTIEVEIAPEGASWFDKKPKVAA